MLMTSDLKKSAVQVGRQFLLGLLILHFVYGRWRRAGRRQLVSRCIDWCHSATACAFAEYSFTTTGGKEPHSVVRRLFPLPPLSPLPSSMSPRSTLLLQLQPLSLPWLMWEPMATSVPFQPMLNWTTHPPLSTPASLTQTTSEAGPEAVVDGAEEVGVGEAASEEGGGGEEEEEEEKIIEFFTVGTALWHNRKEEMITGFYFFPITDAWCEFADIMETTSRLSFTDKGMWCTSGEDPALPAPPAPGKSKSSWGKRLQRRLKRLFCCCCSPVCD